MKKKLLSIILSAAMAATVLSGCQAAATGTAAPADDQAAEEATEAEAAEEGEAEAPAADSAGGKVYYLNFKPEADEQWQSLAKSYTDETGVPVTVVTAASGEYETTLQSEIAKSEAPTMFQVNGPVGLKNWVDYCYDLTGSDIVSNLSSEDFELKGEGGEIYGIAYVIESYGIITNKTLLEKAGYTPDDIKSFDDLKKVAEDITARKDELGFAAFSSAGMDSSSDWRFKTHLANLPIYFEYQEDGISSTDAIKGSYLDNYKNIFDLYINNSTCDPAELSAKTADDSRNEFLNGEAVFYQNGSWEYTALSEKFSDDELMMIPIYVGAGDEAKQGLCTGTENYWCVNAEASEEDIAATLAFMNWCVTSDTGLTMMTDGTEELGGMGFALPFTTAPEPKNVFVKQDQEYTKAGNKPVSWNFTTMPSEEWKNGVGSALTAYAAGSGSWDDVVTAFVDGWATEYALSN
ncbi:MAG: ABC transporter substrate-binding protein [Lachnospiraceae bacterium]|nr:ABC transporter substrate-binding protein [Lachnospiraceae bacterium]